MMKNILMKKKKKRKKKIDYLNLLQFQLNNTLLPDCEQKENIGELDLYLYNSPNLTDEEFSQTIILMVVGKTKQLF